MRIYYGDLNSKIKNLIDYSKKSLIITNNSKEIKKSIYSKDINKSVLVFDTWTLVSKIYRENISTKEIISTDFQKILFLKAIKSTKLNSLNNYDVEILNDVVSIYNEEISKRLIKTSYSNEITKDIEQIISNYKTLINDRYIDKNNVYIEVIDFLKTSTLFFDMEIYIDDIYNYSELELYFINQFIKRRKANVLLLDENICNIELVKTKNNIFLNTINNDYEIEYLRKCNEADKIIGESLFNTNFYLSKLNPRISIYGAGDMYDEVLYVASKIKEEMYKGKLNYHEIALTGPNIEEYRNYIDLILKNNGIPVRESNISNTNFYQFIVNLIDLMISDVTNELLLKIVKSGYYNLHDHSINKYQKYIYENQLMYEKIDLNCFKETEIKEIQKQLKCLLDLKKSETISDFIQDFYIYLNNLEITNKLGEESSEWNSFIDLIDEIYLVFQNESLDLELIKKVFVNLLDKNNSDIYLNEVFVGDLMEVYRKNFKVIFLIGASDDKIPVSIKSDTLLNSKEKQKYYDNYPLFDEIQKQEIYILSSLINKEKHAYVSYHKVGNDKRLKNPSMFVNKLKDMFNLTEDNNNYFNIDKILISKLSTITDNNLNNQINNYFEKNNKYKIYLDSRKYFTKFTDIPKVDSNLIKKRFNGKIFLSASALNTYYQNPFNYFCKYILNIEPIKQNKYDSLLVGEYIHYLLEKTIGKAKTNADYSFFLELKEKYLEEKSIYKKRIIYLLEKLTLNAFNLYQILKRQLEISKYRPKYSEISLVNNEFSKYSLNFSDIEVIITGIVDRIDIYEDKAIIIDYKSGDKKLDYNLLLQGLDLQLFLYSLFISEKTNYKVDGVFYMPSYIKFDSDDKDYRLKGVFLDNSDVTNLLGGDLINEIVDAESRGKLKEGVLLKDEEFSLVHKYVIKKIKEMIANVTSGNFELRPLLITKDYEDMYKSISGLDYRFDNYVKGLKFTKLEALDKMEEEVK